MNISYDSYRVFYYAAKYKSFSQAAAALCNDQPNVTRMIRRLESELRCPLFFRSPRGFAWRQRGKALHAHCRRL
ncbi:MAG: LysR family transcriptional regulator [Oscillospiraceae bacterium]